MNTVAPLLNEIATISSSFSSKKRKEKVECGKQVCVCFQSTQLVIASLRLFLCLISDPKMAACENPIPFIWLKFEQKVERLSTLPDLGFCVESMGKAANAREMRSSGKPSSFNFFTSFSYPFIQTSTSEME